MKPNASVSLQVLPQKSGIDIGIIDEVIKLIQNSNVKYLVGPFETTMEGDLDTLLDIVKKAQKLCIEKGAESVLSFVKIAYSKDGVLTIEEKTSKYN